jgi:hypothetical protein
MTGKATQASEEVLSPRGPLVSSTVWKTIPRSVYEEMLCLSLPRVDV